MPAPGTPTPLVPFSRRVFRSSLVESGQAAGWLVGLDIAQAGRPWGTTSGGAPTHLLRLAGCAASQTAFTSHYPSSFNTTCGAWLAWASMETLAC